MESISNHNNVESNNPTQQTLDEEYPSFEEHMAEVQKSTRKTYQQKAAENKYYLAENGKWYDSYDDPVEAFQLDVEYPDLADKVEDLADRYRIQLADSYGFKRDIYKNAATTSTYSDSHLNDIFKVRATITTRIGGTEAKLLSYDETQMVQIVNSLGTYFHDLANFWPENSEISSRAQEIIGEVSEYFVRNYSEKLVEGNFLQNLAKYTSVAYLDKQHTRSVLRGIEDGIQGISNNEDSGQFFGPYMDYYTELINDNQKITRYDTRDQVFSKFVRHHGINNDTIPGFKNIIFPLLEQQDEEITPILLGGNAYGTTEGTYGIADFTEECLLSRTSPESINKLIRIYHEIPTSDFAKFEQNRKDAARLQGTIIGGRDFIHDERIGVHEVLVAIKNYYEHQNTEDTEKYRHELENLEKKYNFGILPNALNLDAYEKKIEYVPNISPNAVSDQEERAIDILNRLIENTNPANLEAPKTRNPKLNQLLSQIKPIINKQTGEVKVDLAEVGSAITEMNNIIREHSGKQGIFPSMIAAMSFLDKMSTYALRHCDKKELPELPFDPNFKEIVRFSQLTSSIGYSEEAFESNYRKIVELASNAYTEDSIDTNATTEAYRSLSKWIVKNTYELAKHYGEKTNTKRFQEAIWSGNLSDTLISLLVEV